MLLLYQVLWSTAPRYASRRCLPDLHLHLSGTGVRTLFQWREGPLAGLRSLTLSRFRHFPGRVGPHGDLPHPAGCKALGLLPTLKVD